MKAEEPLKKLFSSSSKNTHYWVAFSGGLDSHVLLALCASLRLTHAIHLKAIHVNHKWHPDASLWEAHCQNVCKSLDVPLMVQSITLPSDGKNFEEEARNKRYQIFSDLLLPQDVLLTAHHQDDQAETVLLQLTRGSGLKGLSAMPFIKKFSKGFHARPLLASPRSELKNYAVEHGLQWIEDDSNFNDQFSRNYIRHHLMPRFEARWPSFAATISRTAAHCAEAEALLREFAEIQLKELSGFAAETLSIQKILFFSVPNQKLILRTWMQSRGVLLPNEKKLQSILNNVLHAARDARACVIFGNAMVKRYQDDLYLLSVIEKPFTEPLVWDLKKPLVLKNIGTLYAELNQGPGLLTSIENVSVRFRKGGEKIKLPGGKRHQLKKLFQSWQVPPWERNQVPLIYLKERLIAVAGFAIDPEFAAAPNHSGYHLKLLLD